ncbi:YraN family protein [Ahniella affigens]|uniref:UPF0102 protein C7S18_21800 n=1 Tax=Ahniella affigens TaxID=2021234 RepID=A0A2P1PXS9_9GAMM|nr:YraN family protein [Ahniella affigens]AVP99646.1 YraN family protein [Ahniella affigens]
MISAKRAFGDQVEAAAAVMLGKAGHRILARQANSRYGEIDLITQDGEVIVFVEVRYRADDRFGGGLQSVDRHKQARLIKAAQAWVVQHPRVALSPMRFDVIAAHGPLAALQFEWVKDAFRT